MTKTLKTLGMLFLGVLMVLALGVNTSQAETLSDLTVTGDAHFQYPIYVDGGKIQYGGGDIRTLNFNSGDSQIYQQGDLHVATDDKLYFDFSNPSGSSMTEFASRVQINDNLTAMFPIYAQGNEIVFNGSGVAVKTADGTPRIYRSSDTLRLMAPNMNLDVPGTVTVQADLTVGDDLRVTDLATIDGTLSLSTGSITDSSGAISFGNENLTTTGTLAGGTGSTIGTLTLANGSITDSSGAISFGNENLTTTGTLATTGSITVNASGTAAGYVVYGPAADRTATEGAVMYDSDDNKLYVYNGTTYLDLTAGATGADTLDDAYNASIAAGGADITVDAGTVTWTQSGAYDHVFNFAGTGDFAIQDNGTAVLTVSDAGALTYLGTAAANFDVTTQGAGAIDITSNSGQVSLNSTTGELDLTTANTGATAIDVNATAGGITVDADGNVITITGTADAAGEDVSLIQDGAVDASVVLTSAGTGTDAIDINSSTGSIDIDSADNITIDAVDAFSIDGAGEASNVTLAADGAADDLTIAVTGAYDSSLVLSSAGTGADAIDINATGTAGGIDVDTTDGAITITAAGAAQGDLTISVGDDYANTVAGNYLDTVTGTYGIDAAGATTIDSDAALTLGGAGITIASDGANELDLTSAGLVDLNAGANLDIDVTGTYDMLSSGAFSIDGTGASNVTTDTGNLTVQTTTSGSLILDGVALVDLNAGANLDIDVTGTYAMDSTSTFSIDGVGASNVTTDTGNLTVQTTTSGSLILDGVALVDLNAGANLDIDVTGTYDMLSSGAFSIDGTGASNVTTATGDLTVSATANSVLIDGGEAVADAVKITSSNAAGGIDVNAGTGTLDIDQAGAVAGYGITLDTADAGIHLTAAGAANGDMLLTVGDDYTLAVAGDTVVNASGLWDINATGAATIDSATGVSVDAADASNFTVASDGAADDLTIAVTGATDSSLVLASSGTAADALTITASSGGIDIAAQGTEDLDISAVGGVNMSSSEAADGAITISTSDAAGQIVITSTDTTADALDINTTGGVDVDTTDGAIALTAAGAANGDITLVVGDDYSNTVTGAYLDTVTGTYGIDATGALTMDSDAATVIGGSAMTIAADGGVMDLDATGALSINSSAGVINMGNDAVAQNINIGTGAAARTVTIGNATTTTALALNSGTGDMTLTSADDMSLLVGGAGGILNLATGTEGYVVNLGTDNSAADDINIGSALDNTAITGDDWSVSDAGVASFAGSLAVGGGTALTKITYGTVADGASGWDPDGATSEFTITADAASVTADSLIVVSVGANATAATCGVSTRTAATSFVVKCSANIDNAGTLQYMIVD